MAWDFWSATNPVGNYRNIKKNLENGYQFGDFIRGMWGFSDDGLNDSEDLGLTSPTEAIGNAFNQVTGASASNNFSSAEALRAWERSEMTRLASQDYNSAEAVKAWQRSEESAQRARDFEAQMDNTALQRRMADAEAAGLNPMMLFGGSGLSAGFSGTTAGQSSAASIGSGSSPSATASGNSATAVSAVLLALTKLLKVVM